MSHFIRFMKKTIISLFLLLFGLSTGFAQNKEYISYEHSAEYILADVNVVSNSDKIDKNYVKFLSGFVIGDKINVPGKEVSKALKKLWDEKIFNDVKITASKIEDGKIWLEISVEERPRLKATKFAGVNNTEANNLRDLIKVFNGEILTPNLIYNSKYKIKDYLDDKGYLTADITVNEQLDTNGLDGVILYFTINKGEKVKIERISINGNEKLTDYEVKQVMKNTKERSEFLLGRDIWNLVSKPKSTVRNINADEEKYGFYPMLLKYFKSSFRFNIFKSSKYVPLDYEEDKDNIIALYNKNGFRDARILSDSIWYEGSKMFINIDVEEGKKYFIRNVSWLGNTKYST